MRRRQWKSPVFGTAGSCQKIVFDLHLADLPAQKIDLGFVGGLVRRSAVLEDARRAIPQPLLQL